MRINTIQLTLTNGDDVILTHGICEIKITRIALAGGKAEPRGFEIPHGGAGDMEPVAQAIESYLNETHPLLRGAILILVGRIW